MRKNRGVLPTWRLTLIRFWGRIRRSSWLIRRVLQKIPVMNILYPEALRKEVGFKETIHYGDNITLTVDTQSWIEWLLFLNGSYEPHLQKVFQQYLKQGDNVLDVGANIGVHSLFLSKLVGQGGRIISLEPYPPVLEKLKQNIAKNHVDNITVIPVTASDKQDILNLVNTQADNQGTASLWHDSQQEILDQYTVHVTTLDAIAKEQNLEHIALIKMDIQGNEARALLGSRQILRDFQPILIFEYDHSWKTANADLDTVLEYLRTFDYHLYSLTLYGQVVELNQERYTEIIALPKTKSP